MYYLYGYKFILNNTNLLLGFKESIFDLNNPELSSKYNIFLNDYSVFSSQINWKKPLIINFKQLKEFAFLYYQNNKQHFIPNSSILDERIKGSFFENAFKKLSDLNVDLYHLSQFFIKTIVVNHMCSYTNGTTEDTLGLSIMNFKDEFIQQDFIELIIHQLTHMFVFIDDRINSHMDENNRTYMIPTKFKFILGGNSFPAYLAFHSFVVAVEVLLFRYHTDMISFKGEYHGDSNRIKNIITEFSIQLKKYSSLFTESGQKILFDAIEKVNFLMDKKYESNSCS